MNEDRSRRRRTTCGPVVVCARFVAVALFLCINGSAWAAQKPRVNIDVVQATPADVILDYSFGDYAAKEVAIDGQMYTRINLGREAHILRAGAPDLPRVSRSIVIPDDAAMSLKITSTRYYEIENIDIAPSKGNLLRSVDPDDVPYTFDENIYKRDAFYPGPVATLGDPYILRDVRGVVVRVNPFQYNPVRHTLRVYTELTVEVAATGPGRLNVLPPTKVHTEPDLAFHQIYKHHFLNYQPNLRYPPLDETGDMLIICYDAWIPNVQPLADHKTGIGIDTTIVGISSIGNTTNAIKSYIQNVYNSSDLAFVLLVGDAAQITTPIVNTGASDPWYAKLVGNDDYPDIIIGRFSAESAGDVDTQVQRTIAYENDHATMQDWFWKGVGIASDQGAGIGDEGQSDRQHEDEIRGWLLGDGYTLVDQVYDPGASAATLANAINSGRGIINYTGHGWEQGWSTTGFSNSNVNALTNTDMLPFIVSVACLNGAFTGTTCFGEAWLRATDTSGQPTGAIGIYASSVSCSWAPPMEMQDEFNILYTDASEPYHAFGTMCFAGSCSSIDAYGSEGVAIYDEYQIFGDPSVRIIGTVEPPTGLSVSGTDLAAAGQRGGPYTPDSTTYTLQNRNDTPIAYDVSVDVPWVDVSLSSGTLAGGESLDIVVSLNAAANTLSHGLHEGTITFTNLTDHDGDTQRPVSIDVDAKNVQYSFPMDSDPGWSTQGAWAFGQPTGDGSHNGDPAAGHTGNNVYGYNLNGDYTNNLTARYLTTSALDCSNLSLVELRFWRWLGVESNRYDHAAVEVSADGTNWTPVWTNPDDTLTDTNWVPISLDISAMADGQPTVYIRWKMGTTDGSVTYPGWNIDDVEIWAVPETVPGDLDGDGDVDLGDLSILLAHYGTTGGAQYEDGDLDGDGDVDLADLSMLLANYGYGT